MTTTLNISINNEQEDQICLEMTPDPHFIETNSILYIIAPLLQVLGQRVGLEQAIKTVQETAYGRIDDKNISVKWIKESKNNIEELEE